MEQRTLLLSLYCTYETLSPPPFLSLPPSFSPSLSLALTRALNRPHGSRKTDIARHGMDHIMPEKLMSYVYLFRRDSIDGGTKILTKKSGTCWHEVTLAQGHAETGSHSFFTHLLYALNLRVHFSSFLSFFYNFFLFNFP